MEGIKLSPQQRDVKPNYAYFPVVFDEKVFGATRNEVAHHLAEHDIMARKYFYPLITELECYKRLLNRNVTDTPTAKNISDNILCLPMYADLSLKDVDRICSVVLK